MDISPIQLGTRVREFISLRMGGLSKNSKKTAPNPEVLKIARGFAFTIMAAMMGWAAQSATERNTRIAILEGEWPHSVVFQNTLRQGGWSPISMSDYDAFLKQFPSSAHGKAGIWTTDDHCTVFIQQSQNSSELWTCSASRLKAKSKVSWIRLGSGYDGINQLARIKPPISKKAASYIDPNEIRY